jgi:transcriptional regulator with XRE-family HTH domain
LWLAVRASRQLALERDSIYSATRLAAELGAQVRSLGQERGWSQAYLAVAAGTSQSTVSRLELGYAASSMAVLASVASALDTNLIVTFGPPAGA